MIGKLIALLVLLLLGSASVMASEAQAARAEGVCGDTEGNAFTLSTNRKLNQSSGEWLRTFHARKVEKGKASAGILDLEASQGSVECDGKIITHVRVVVKDAQGDMYYGSQAQKEDGLLFHPRHGKNVVVMNGGRSVQKLNLDDPLNGVVFTHRPLKNNELFEVRLDKRIKKNNNCFALGVMIHSPDTVEILPSMHNLKNGTWVYHNSAMYGSKKELSRYGKDLNKIQERERLGVMRREDGSIHFFMNGVDLGRAVESVPGPVYGIFELWYDAIIGTIV